MITDLLTLKTRAKSSIQILEQVVLRLQRRHCLLNICIAGLGIEDAPRKNVYAPVTTVLFWMPVNLWCLCGCAVWALLHFHLDEPHEESPGNELLFHFASPIVSGTLT